MRKIANIFWLGTKEIRSFVRDFVLLGLVIYTFSLAIIAQSQSNAQELHNASIAFLDEDQSELSRRIVHAFLPPYFQTPRPIAERDIVPLMNAGRYTFVIDIPPNFERYVLGGRGPAIQLNVDATAMVQAGLGSGYAQQIILTELRDFVAHRQGTPLLPVNINVRVAFNPNIATAWFTSVMGIINNVTMLAIILAGAAIVREREHGTMDHLLVMPLTPFEIAMSKVWANGLDDHHRRRSFALYRRSRDARRSDRRVDSLVHAWDRDLSFLRLCRRRISRHRGTLHAAARPAVLAGLLADEHVVRQQYAARKHAAVAGDPDAGLAFHAFCVVCAVDPLSRRGH